MCFSNRGDAYGCYNLERSAEVLFSKVMHAEPCSSASDIDCKPPIATAESNHGNERSDEPGRSAGGLERPAAGDQPRAHSPA